MVNNTKQQEEVVPPDVFVWRFSISFSYKEYVSHFKRFAFIVLGF